MKKLILIMVVALSATAHSGDVKTPHKTELRLTTSTGAKITVKIEAPTFKELNTLVSMVRDQLTAAGGSDE